MSICLTSPSTFELGDFPPPDLTIRRLSVAEYHQMMQAGILQSGDPIELLEGILVTKMTKHPPHILACELVADALRAALPPGWFLRSQDPMTTRDSEPEPDHMVVRGTRRDYANRHPAPSEITLVVEVSADSLPRDRGTKKRLYARAEIVVYWILNLVDRQLEVYTDPTGPGEVPDYKTRDVFSEAQSVRLVIDGNEVGAINVKELLP